MICIGSAGAIVKDGKLQMLPDEKVYEKLEDIVNLSSDQGNIGFAIVTNFRFVWFAKLANNFNISLPYLQIKAIKKRVSKFGNTIVVHTRPGYILGFQVEPKQRADNVAEMVSNLHKLYHEHPNFGVKFAIEDKPQNLEHLTVKRPEEKTNLVPNQDAYGIPVPRNTLYSVNKRQNEDADPCYNSRLGLAVQALPEGITIESIWKL